jgi:hypothetical protein
MANRIACSPLTGRIHMGRVDKTGSHFVGQKQDVTSDVLRCFVEKAAFHGGTFEIKAGEKTWTAKIEATGQEDQPAAGRPPAST